MCLINILKTLNEYGSLVQAVLVSVGLGIAIWQLIDLKANVRASSINQIVNNTRELFAFRLKNKTLLQDNYAAEIYQIMLLNHSVNAYAQHEKGILEEDWWIPMLNDMKQTFNKNDFKELWQKVKKSYSDTFQKFMDTKILT
jgi:uncharacterized membrane protein YfhO